MSEGDELVEPILAGDADFVLGSRLLGEREPGATPPQWPQTPVPGTSYVGELFFDFVVTWLEFGPLFYGWTLRHGGKERPSGNGAEEQR